VPPSPSAVWRASRAHPSLQAASSTHYCRKTCRVTHDEYFALYPFSSAMEFCTYILGRYTFLASAILSSSIRGHDGNEFPTAFLVILYYSIEANWPRINDTQPRYKHSQPAMSLPRVCFSESRCHHLFACTVQPRLSSHPPTAGGRSHTFLWKGVSGSLEKAGFTTFTDRAPWCYGLSGSECR
jgi:hypothetical protein